MLTAGPEWGFGGGGGLRTIVSVIGPRPVRAGLIVKKSSYFLLFPIVVG